MHFNNNPQFIFSNIYSLGVPVYRGCAWCLRRAGESVGFLGLKLQPVVSHRVRARNRPGSSARAASALSHMAVSSGPSAPFYISQIHHVYLLGSKW